MQYTYPQNLAIRFRLFRLTSGHVHEERSVGCTAETTTRGIGAHSQRHLVTIAMILLHTASLVTMTTR